MLEKVLNDLQVKEDELQSFEVEDPFNPQNVLKGFISIRSDHRYGTVALTHINGRDAYQIQFGTPKQRYPFGNDGNFHFPTASEIEVYDKLDGTNVFAYRYSRDGERFQTYKLRLSPVLRNSKFGEFLELWKEILGRYPQISRVCEVNNCGISFEMYGSRNTHLILYEEPLDIALLFGIDNEARILSPSKLNCLEIPSARLLARITSHQELVQEYNRFREDIEKRNIKNEDETISGSEGVVWYLSDLEGKIMQFKCKPESVEEIHWANCAIDINTIRATAHNVLETEDEITYEGTTRLLREEFSSDQVELSETRIKNVIEDLRQWYAFQREVLDIYNGLGVSINDDKGRVMRKMSEHFPKQQMKKVYTAIVQSGK